MIGVIRLAHEKVAELWAVRDDLIRLQQLGLVSAPGRSERADPT
ncbi:MAG TPA: hypothetical protein VE525_05755 [Rubrobacter sp.]|jgi:hypothetical protein|nr:hypothetical protein [Rubrobacter sp.]